MRSSAGHASSSTSRGDLASRTTEGQGHDYDVVEGPDDRQELGDEVNRRKNPETCDGHATFARGEAHGSPFEAVRRRRQASRQDRRGGLSPSPAATASHRWP